MILCTGCGAKNPDDAHQCGSCGRKLQSRWAASASQAGQAGAGASRPRSALESSWQALEPILHTFDENAGRLVRKCAETWVYALLLIFGVGLFAVTENWTFLAGAIVLAGGMAWLRGV